MGSDTRSLVHRRVAASRPTPSYSLPLVCCLCAPLLLFLVQSQQQSPQRPVAIVETVRPIAALSSPSAAVLPSGGGHAKFTPIHSTAATAAATTAAATTAAAAAVAIAAPQPRSPLVPQRRLEHESDMPMSVLNRERAKQAGEYGGAFRVYRPPRGAVRERHA